VIFSVIWVVGEIGLLVTAVGLVARDRWRLSFFFAAYVPVVLTCTALMKWWPERFWVAEFWIAKETIYRVLMLGMALEVAWRTFRAFPGARSASLKTALMILAMTAFAILAVPTISSVSNAFETALGQLHPRLINGTIWLMAATLALAQWYRVPVHPFHAALLTSPAAYLALLNTVLSFIGLYGIVRFDLTPTRSIPRPMSF
jgi:hypothetical protein